MASDGVVAADHFTTVASPTQIEIALMGRPGTPAVGTVSWERGEVLQRYDDFLDCYLSMMELNKINTSHLRRDFSLKPDGVPRAVIAPRRGLTLLPAREFSQWMNPMAGCWCMSPLRSARAFLETHERRVALTEIHGRRI